MSSRGYYWTRWGVFFVCLCFFLVLTGPRWPTVMTRGPIVGGTVAPQGSTAAWCLLCVRRQVEALVLRIWLTAPGTIPLSPVPQCIKCECSHSDRPQVSGSCSLLPSGHRGTCGSGWGCWPPGLGWEHSDPHVMRTCSHFIKETYNKPVNNDMNN